MKYRKLGHSGLRVSLAGLGCNNFGMRCDKSQSVKVVHAALDIGINFFDTANVYGGQQSETFLGRALEGQDRSQIVIATKFGHAMGDGILQKGGSRQHIFSAVDASLTRLGTDYIDLYQHHIPDPHTPIEETLSALTDLVAMGKVRYIGHSNYSGWQIADAHWCAQTNGYQRFVTAQNQYNLLQRDIEKEVLPACDQFEVGMLPYFPLASGLLTGKYKRGEEAPADSRLANFGERGKKALSERNFDQVDKLTQFAEARGKSLLELAIGWLASNTTISSVIAGATTPEQVTANAHGVGWQLDDDEIAELNTALKN